MKNVSCDELLSAYLDGELSEPERLEIERWLEQSAEARRLLAELQAVSNMVAGLPERRLDDDLAPRVVAEIERARLVPFRRPAWARVARWSAAAAAVAAAVAGVWLIVGDGPETEDTVSLAQSPTAEPENSSLELQIADRGLDRGVRSSESGEAANSGTARELAPVTDSTDPPALDEQLEEPGDTQNLFAVQIPQTGQVAVPLNALRDRALGNVIEGIHDNGVVELVVVDRRRAFQRLEVLLEANGVPVVANVPAPELPPMVADADIQANTVEALCVEATPEQLNNTLAQLAEEEELVVGLNVQAAPAEFVAQTDPSETLREEGQQSAGGSVDRPAQQPGGMAGNQGYLVQLPEPRGEPGRQRVPVVTNSMSPLENQRFLAEQLGRMQRNRVARVPRSRGEPLQVIVIVRDAESGG